MLSQLTNQEKEEIVFNSVLLKRAIDEIADLTKSEKQVVLQKLVALAESDMKQITTAMIDEMIAASDQIRAAAEKTNSYDIYYVVGETNPN